MSNIEDGGPAFPTDASPETNGGWNTTRNTGMSMRDYFAAKAMNGLMARVGAHDADVVAHDAYLVADAMLKAREA